MDCQCGKRCKRIVSYSEETVFIKGMDAKKYKEMVLIQCPEFPADVKAHPENYRPFPDDGETPEHWQTALDAQHYSRAEERIIEKGFVPAGKELRKIDRRPTQRLPRG